MSVQPSVPVSTESRTEHWIPKIGGGVVSYPMLGARNRTQVLSKGCQWSSLLSHLFCVLVHVCVRAFMCVRVCECVCGGWR